MKRGAWTLIAALAAAVAVSGAVASAASAATVSGQITCVANPPMGAWLTAWSNGGSGWVSWSRLSGTNTIRYSKTFNGGWWYLSVGCGGSTAVWGKVTYTDSYYGGGVFNFTCYDVRNAYFAYLRCQRT